MGDMTIEFCKEGEKWSEDCDGNRLSIGFKSCAVALATAAAACCCFVSSS